MTTVGDMLYQMGGVPVGAEFTTGSVFFVDSNTGSNSNDGKTPDTAFATLDFAIGNCTASKGDIIYLMPGHAETTSAIAWDVAGISVLGIGHGASRPTITATTGATDLINVTAASARLENIILVGAASGCTALLDLSAAADDIIIRRCKFASGAAPTAQLTIAPGANDGLIEDCHFIGTAAGLAQCISFETSIVGTDNEDWIIRRCYFNATESAGCDDSMIQFTTSSGGVTGILVDNCRFIGLADGDGFINPLGSSSGRATGLVVDCKGQAADASDATLTSGLLGYVDVYTTEPGKFSGGAVSNSASVHPVVTPAA